MYKQYDDIYVLVRNKGTEKLSLKVVPVYLEQEPSIEQISGAFEFAYGSLEDTYHSKLYEDPYLIYSNLKDFRCEAFAYSKAIEYIEKELDFVAYSHKKGGVRQIYWEYNKDFKFSIESNFGYGYTSYLISKYYYKGILLYPFSLLGKYSFIRYAHMERPCLHTYIYPVEYVQWYKLLFDALKLYNDIAQYGENAIIKWLEHELNDFVLGLHNICYATDSYSMLIYPTNNEIETFTGLNLVCLKIDKIVGAIGVIGEIKVFPFETLKKTYVDKIHELLKVLRIQLREYNIKYSHEKLLLTDQNKDTSKLNYTLKEISKGISKIDDYFTSKGIC